MADGYNIDELRAAGLSEADIAELMAFDLTEYQKTYQANQKAAEDARARGLTAAEATGLSDRYVALNDPRANDLIGGGINEQIMGRLGLIPQSYDYAPVFNIKGDQEYENYNFVPVPGKTYRLVDNNSGQVIGTATTPAEAKGLAEAANAISNKQGGNANWALQEYGSYSDGKGNMTSGYSDVYTNEKSGVMNDLKPLIQAAVVMAAVGTGLAAVTAPAAGGAGAGAAAAGAGGAGAGAAGTGSLVSSSALASSTASNLAAISKAASSAASAAGLTSASSTLLADVGISALRGGITSAAMGGDPITGALTAGLGEFGSQVIGPLVQSQEVARIGSTGNFIIDSTREATRLGSAVGSAVGSAAGSLIAGEGLRDIALTGGISGVTDYLSNTGRIQGERPVVSVGQKGLTSDLNAIAMDAFQDLKDTGILSSFSDEAVDNALSDILVTAASETKNTLGSFLNNAGKDALSTALTNSITGGDNVFVYGQETPAGGSMGDTIKGISGDILITGATQNDGRGRDTNTTVFPDDIFVNAGRVTTAPTSPPTTQVPEVTVTARVTTAPTTAPTTQAPEITITARVTTAPTTAPTTQAPGITVTARPTTAPTTAPTTQAPTITVTARPTTAATTQSPTVSPTYPTASPTRPPTWGTKDWVMLGLAAPNLINRVVGKGEDVGTITPDKSAVTFNPLNRQRGVGSFDPFTYGQAGPGYQTSEFEFFKPYTMEQPEQKYTPTTVSYTPGADIYEYTPEQFSTMQQNATKTYNERTAAFNNYQQMLAKQVESGALTMDQALAEARAYAEPYGGAIIQQKADGGYIEYADGGEAEDDMVKHLLEYRKGGGHNGPGPVKGIGSGQEDKIPAWLSDGEYVWSAQDVADLGDGSTDEGVRRLDKMRQMVRKQAGRKDVKKIAKPQRGIEEMLKAVGGKV